MGRIISNNSNLHPMGLRGQLYDSTYSYPYLQPYKAYVDRGTEQPAKIGSPIQVMGLVPMFPCCTDNILDSIGNFVFGVVEGNTYFSYSIGSLTSGTFMASASTTDSALQATLNQQLSVLTSFTCTVTHSGPTWTVLLHSPFNSGPLYNGTTVSLHATGDGVVIATNNFRGGSNDNSPDCDCRQDGYMADSTPNDQLYILPVFASLTEGGTYFNDSNSWLFWYAGTYNPFTLGDFRLQELQGTTWTTLDTITSANTYGQTFRLQDVSKNISGFTIQWQNVLQTYGEGTYRIHIGGYYSGRQYPYCLNSPSFCLQPFDCFLTDGTVKFETESNGGVFGSVDIPGQQWELTYTTPTGVLATYDWNDSIRIPGFFGYESVTYERDSIKYQQGQIVKVRDEAIKEFTFKSDNLPMWLHQRFYSYGLMSDNLWVNDYNANNANYNYKHFGIVANSAYKPKYLNYSRYIKVIDVTFNESQQDVFRSRCN